MGRKERLFVYIFLYKIITTIMKCCYTFGHPFQTNPFLFATYLNRTTFVQKKVLFERNLIVSFEKPPV